MRVLIDIRKLGDGGIGVYIENLIDGLLELPSEVSQDLSLSLLVDPQVASDKISPLFGNVAGVLTRWSNRVSLIPEAAPKYSLAEYFSLPKRHKGILADHDLYHSPHYTLPYSLPIPSVSTIHDIIHVSHPETFLHKFLGKRLIRSALRRAESVITVSCASEERLRLLDKTAADKIRVIPNAVRFGLESPDPVLLQSYRKKKMLEDSPFGLFVGSERPHKGLDSLLEAWTEFKDSIPLLVLVGDRYSSATQQRVKKLGLEKSVRFFGSVRTKELAQLYHACDAVIVPSREEGFGLVALEAMSSGKPIVCSPALSLREVCRDCAWYAKDHSSEALGDALQLMWSDPSERAEKVRKGYIRAQNFSRARIAAETLAVYQSIVSENVQQEAAAL